MIQFTKAQFKRKLAQKTQCTIQYNGWTCGTCFYSISPKLKHIDWASLLFYRGDYKKEDFDLKTYNKVIKNQEKSLNKIWELIK